jgi:hypothetical protein
MAPAPGLLVAFPTADNRRRLLALHGTTIRPGASLCRTERFDPSRMAFTPGWTNGPRNAAEAGDDRDEARQDEAGRSRDRRRQPADLCLRLHGGSMTGGTFTSSTIRIPADLIRATLDRAGRRLPPG